jgi:single-stranded DNA-binding protein
MHCAFTATVVADAERKVSKAGRAFLRFRCREGEGDRARWISVTSFSEGDLDLADGLVKGAAVAVEGKHEINSWVATDGTTKQGEQVVATYLRLCELGRAKKPDKAPKSGRELALTSPQAPARDLNDEIPF